MVFRKSHIHTTVISDEANQPITGDTTMNSAVLLIFDQPKIPSPAFETPAPIKPPTKACDELEGRPHHQVSKFHAMAPPRAPMMTAMSTIFGSMMPLPMVPATCKSKTANAMKLKKAAHSTA